MLSGVNKYGRKASTKSYEICVISRSTVADRKALIRVKVVFYTHGLFAAARVLDSL